MICHENMSDTGGKRLPCSHVFHAGCLREWIQQSPSCPSCRASLDLQVSGGTHPPLPSPPLFSGWAPLPCGWVARYIGGGQHIASLVTAAGGGPRASHTWGRLLDLCRADSHPQRPRRPPPLPTVCKPCTHPGTACRGRSLRCLLCTSEKSLFCALLCGDFSVTRWPQRAP